MHEALALAAGEFVREARRHVGRQARPCCSSSATRSRASRRVGEPVHDHRLGDRARRPVLRGLRLANGSWKIICMRRRTARRPRLPSPSDVLALEADRAGGRLDQPQDRAAGRRLAAAGLADQRQRLAGAAARRTRSRPRGRGRCTRPNMPPRMSKRVVRSCDLEQRPRRRRRRVRRSAGCRRSPVVGIEHRQAQRRRLAAHRAELRHGGEQRARVGLLRAREELRRSSPSSTLSPLPHHQRRGRRSRRRRPCRA